MANQAPVITGGFSSIAANATIAASTLFSVSDPDGDPIVQYFFADYGTGAGSSYFTLNGVVQAAGSPFLVNASDLPNLIVHGGSVAGTTDAFQVRALDSVGNPSNWVDIGLTVQNPPGTTPVRDDFDGDGKSDILWHTPSGQVAMWGMNGMNIANGVVLGNGGAVETGGWHIANTGDFNGDAKTDLLWHNTNGQVAVWQMNGSNIQQISVLDGGQSQGNWQIAQVGDFGGDGKSDILWRTPSGQVALWEMNGMNIANGVVLGNGGAVESGGWQIANIGDFNGDGKSDLLWHNTNGQVAIWQMNGSNIQQISVLDGGQSQGNWQIAGVGDFGGDGKSDILWRNPNGQVALWQMNGMNIANGVVLGNGGAVETGGWQIANIGDFNGDGRSDLLWHNTNGQAAVWEMNGSNILQLGLLAGGQSQGDWIINPT